MARSIWNGTITFGLTTLPVKVHSATEDKGVHFHQVHAKDGARIKQKRICSKQGKEVPYKQVAKGYEVSEGEYVMLSQKEIDAAAGDHSHLIELEEFVRAEELDPVYYDRTYYLGAGEGGHEAYRLLHDALERSDRVGIGRWVFHNREYLIAVRSLDRVLALHSLRFAAELIDAKSLELPSPSRGPSKREVEMAQSLVDALHDRFDPRSLKDSYRERVLELIKARARGEEPELPEAPVDQETPDLIAALEASLSGSGRNRTGSKRSNSRAKSEQPAHKRGRSGTKRGKAKG